MERRSAWPGRWIARSATSWPLDIEAASMVLALCRGIRARYPLWRLLMDGDGGDENLKDYPIEENPELTIRSVVNNLMLYHRKDGEWVA